MSDRSAEIKDLEDWFEKADLPKEIELSPGIKITDCRKFVKSHLEYCKDGHPEFIKPYFDHLKELQKALALRKRK
jgi:hypothetical protein